MESIFRVALTQGTSMTPTTSTIVNRRRLITSGLTGVGLAMLPTSIATANANRNRGIIDAHVHVWTPDTQRFPLAEEFTKQDMQPASYTPEELMADAAPAGVTRVVLIQMSYYRYDNAYMLHVMEQHAGVYAGVAIVDEDDQPARHMRELAKQGVRGFRIAPGKRNADSWLQGVGMREMWRCGADERLAMCHLIDPKHLPSVAAMCRSYRATPVVIDHFARIGADGKIRDQDLDHLCRLATFPNVSVKISAYYALGKKRIPYTDLGPMIQRLISEFGSERLMWASDCPFQVQGNHTYQASLDLIQFQLDFLTPEDRAELLHNTAERVFFS